MGTVVTTGPPATRSGPGAARATRKWVGPFVAASLALALVAWGRPLAALAVALLALALGQAQTLHPGFGPAVRRGVASLRHGAGRALSFVALGALFVVVIVPFWVVTTPLRRRPFGVPRGADGWVPRTPAPRVAAGGETPTEETGPIEAAPRRAVGGEPSRRRLTTGGLLGRLALAVVALVALDVALGAFLGGTGIAPGEQAAFLQAQRWLVDTMDAPAVRDEPWAEQYTEDGLRLFAERQDYEPYLMYGFHPYESRYINTTDLERISYQPAVPDGEEPLRVAIFGGSVVWGVGQRDDHTIASELARVAESEGIALEVHNYGMYGWVAWQQYQYFERLLAAGERYDLAVFYDGLNDFAVQQSDFSEDPTHGGSQLMRHLGGEVHQRYYTEPGYLDSVRDLATAYRRNSGVARLVDRFTRAPGELPSWMQSERVASPAIVVDTALDVYARSHAAARDVAARHDVPVRFVLQPQAHGWDPAFLDGLPPGTIDGTRVYDGVEDDVYLDGAHTNELGARLAAEDLWGHVRPALDPATAE
ncbi:MAG: SGNH/GDSL hydrolase family protein [Acidimicrobiales bacterium]|nr:SGNH/GDSL hydrolase family protein [Acidimicrobiales bacterium]